MQNKHDEIKKLLKATRQMLSGDKSIQEEKQILKKYNLLSEEQEIEYETSETEYETADTEEDIKEPGNISKKLDVAKSVEKKIEDEENPKKEKKQAYRISGGILVFHSKDPKDLELTTDDKIAFQETMDEFNQEVSDMADFNKLNVYPNNVEWSGKIVDFDIDFFYSIGEENGIYIKGDMIRTDDKFLEMVNKLKSYYEKFKSKWAKIISSRKKTKK